MALAAPLWVHPAMDNFQPPADCAEDRALGLEADHVTELQTGRRIGRSGPDDKIVADAAHVQAALLDAGGRLVSAGGPEDDVDIEGPNSQ
jgi:hypothetical protein